MGNDEEKKILEKEMKNHEQEQVEICNIKSNNMKKLILRKGDE